MPITGYKTENCILKVEKNICYFVVQYIRTLTQEYELAIIHHVHNEDNGEN